MTDSFDKGADVEEWSDRHFFRPIGLRVARACAPTRITADQLTVVALVIGLLAGHLLFYRSVLINAIGVALFVVSDIFDSADGQLARMRRTSTRFGRILDGLSDTTRFANLYLTLLVRLLASGDGALPAIALVLAAGLAHSAQSGVADYIKQLYLDVAQGGRGELDLPEDLSVDGATAWERFSRRTYAGYVRRQARFLPVSVAAVRAMRTAPALDADVRWSWANAQRGVVHQCAWIGQNIRFLLLAVTVVPGHPALYLWITLVPMSLVLVAIVVAHERHTASLFPASTSRLAEAAPS